jgi:hypothetical protein
MSKKLNIQELFTNLNDARKKLEILKRPNELDNNPENTNKTQINRVEGLIRNLEKKIEKIEKIEKKSKEDNNLKEGLKQDNQNLHYEKIEKEIKLTLNEVNDFMIKTIDKINELNTYKYEFRSVQNNVDTNLLNFIKYMNGDDINISIKKNKENTPHTKHIYDYPLTEQEKNDIYKSIDKYKSFAKNDIRLVNDTIKEFKNIDECFELLYFLWYGYVKYMQEEPKRILLEQKHYKYKRTNNFKTRRRILSPTLPKISEGDENAFEGGKNRRRKTYKKRSKT